MSAATSIYSKHVYQVWVLYQIFIVCILNIKAQKAKWNNYNVNAYIDRPLCLTAFINCKWPRINKEVKISTMIINFYTNWYYYY